MGIAPTEKNVSVEGTATPRIPAYDWLGVAEEFISA